MRHLKVCASLAACLALALFVTTAPAADKADPNGTWKYTVMPPGGEAIEVTLKLKLEGDKLTGTTKRGDMETKIEEGKFKDGEVSFQVTRERDGNKFVVKYKGKVDGDAIKGKIMVNFMGQDNEIEWNAKREKK